MLPRRGALLLALSLAACRPTASPALRHHGEPLPLTASDGASADLRDLATPVTVVVFWASFCAPCIEHLPELEALAERDRGEADLRLFVVSVDPPESRERARELIAERAPTLPAYFDAEGSLARWLMPRTKAGRTTQILPLIAVIDADGAIHRRVNFETDRSGVSVVEVIEGALAGDMPPAMADVFAQRNPSLPPPGATVTMTVREDLSAEGLEDVLAWVERIYRQNPELSDDAIAAILDDVRQRIEAGETRFELLIPARTQPLVEDQQPVDQ